MAKYRLLARHLMSNQQLLEAGTEVGDDTPYPWCTVDGEELPPTTQMEGIDDDGRQKVRDLHRTFYGRDPHWDREDPTEESMAQEAQAEEQKELDESSDPVSRQQKVERDMEEDMSEFPEPKASAAVLPGPGRMPSNTATAAPTTGGERAPSPGPATPEPPKKEDVRPKNPNEDQYPKG